MSLSGSHHCVSVVHTVESHVGEQVVHTVQAPPEIGCARATVTGFIPASNVSTPNSSILSFRRFITSSVTAGEWERRVFRALGR